jgi:hypothetical protein
MSLVNPYLKIVGTDTLMNCNPLVNGHPVRSYPGKEVLKKS